MPTTLLLIFASLAFILAATGIYGVIAFSVSQRVQEIGIRRALGAVPSKIFQLVLGHGLVLTVAGVVCGVIAAFALTKLLTNFLFQVRSSDAATYLFVSILLILVSILASAVPAIQATRIDPIEALRQE